jgi:hypothetical protein
LKPVYRAPVIKELVFLGVALSFTGASCSGVSSTDRVCPGLKVESVTYAAGGCGASGTIIISAETAGDCTLTVLEPTAVGLPSAGYFGSAATATGYDFAKGNWQLVSLPTGNIGDNAGLNCTSSAGASPGSVQLNCIITTCTTSGESQDPSCTQTGSCVEQLVPISGDASVGLTGGDAGAPAADATAG